METTLGGDESTDHIVGEKAEKDDSVEDCSDHCSVCCRRGGKVFEGGSEPVLLTNSDNPAFRVETEYRSSRYSGRENASLEAAYSLDQRSRPQIRRLLGKEPHGFQPYSGEAVPGSVWHTCHQHAHRAGSSLCALAAGVPGTPSAARRTSYSGPAGAAARSHPSPTLQSADWFGVAHALVPQRDVSADG
jgi:hypothetical protein